MEFFQTGMGKKFYEGTLPKIAAGIENFTKELKKANDLKERELELKEKKLNQAIDPKKE